MLLHSSMFDWSWSQPAYYDLVRLLTYKINHHSYSSAWGVWCLPPGGKTILRKKLTHYWSVWCERELVHMIVETGKYKISGTGQLETQEWVDVITCINSTGISFCKNPPVFSMLRTWPYISVLTCNDEMWKVFRGDEGARDGGFQGDLWLRLNRNFNSTEDSDKWGHRSVENQVGTLG